MDFSVAKQAVAYYCMTTGNLWDTFYNNLDEAMSMPLPMQTGDMWLIHALMNKVIDSGVSLNDFKINKDAVKALFDEEDRKLKGEFFTPEVWAEELHKYMDKHIPNWRTTYNVWENSCGSGNLIRSAKITPEHLFASSIQESDIIGIKNTPELTGCTAFTLDFLNSVDDLPIHTNFFDSLPENLQKVIENKEPLIFLCNPPYKTGQANATAVGKYMSDPLKNVFYEQRDLSRAAYDLFYQFCYQMMNFMVQYDLKDAYCCVFGPLTWFTGAGANTLLKAFEHCFEFIDGMCISAQEFSDTSESILWGIGATIWKFRGGYKTGADDLFHKDILLDKKYLLPNGTVGTEGKILYEPPRAKLSDWVSPNELTDTDITERVDMPLMTSHLTFKGGDAFGKTVYKTVKFPPNVLGTLMLQNTLTRSSDQRAILSMPATIQYSYITRENFWRCVSSFAFRSCFDATWSIAKKEISAPNTNVEGYDIWVRNALVLFIFDYKAMMNSMRNVTLVDKPDITWSFNNKLFFLTENEVREACSDPVILSDLEANPPQNQFMIEQIKSSEPYWTPTIRQLYDWCKTYTLATYNMRKSVDYNGSLDCWDAGFQQLRSSKLWDAEKYDAELSKLLTTARDMLSRDLDKFGFVSEIENTADI